MSTSASYDVIVIGAGPAGSAAAAMLAGQGRRVVVIERERFPRYHIGESLIPFTSQPLKRLGLLEQMRQSEFVKKYSVQFVSPSAVPQVIACGGSWLTPTSAITVGDYATVTRLAIAARAIATRRGRHSAGIYQARVYVARIYRARSPKSRGAMDFQEM